jgi:hypothetical protein
LIADRHAFSCCPYLFRCKEIRLDFVFCDAMARTTSP